jgi:type I restriction enzyme M protein
MVRRREVQVEPSLFDAECRSPKETFRYLRNFLAGRFIGATRDDALLEEILKCLFCKLYLETNGRAAVDHEDAGAARAYREIFEKIRGDFPEIYDESTSILLDDSMLLHVMGTLRFSLLDASSDPIGDAYEVFAGSESRARSGQFFTPRNATDLLVRVIDPQPGELIIDPACGAGGFLASVARHFRKQGHSNTKIAQAAKNLYGVEKDSYLANLARLHVTVISKGHVNIRCGDSLALTTEQGEPLESVMPTSGFDVLLANPPFGVNIVSASAEVLRRFDLARQWKLDKEAGRWVPNGIVRVQVPPQVLFVERCLSLVKDGGRLGTVLPESVLSNKSYRYVVEYIRSLATVEAVMGMPESLFKTSGKGGTHTKTCLLVLTKGRAKRRGAKIFMAEAQWCGHDSRAREIPHDDLPKIGDQFELHKKRKRLDPSPLGFLVDEAAVAENVLCPRYFDPELDAELHRLQKTHTVIRFGDLITDGTVEVDTGHEVGKLAYGTGDIPFVRTSDLSNWEIKADPKHCVGRDLYLSLKDKQDVRENDLLMVKDGTYLIGTCAIVTEYDREIIFQSHIYKIRVKDNPHGLTPFLLLALLGSSVVQRQIRAKQFTQDIIDSLGERIKDLLLPIPKSAAKREHVSELVRKVIRDRIEARELARKARVRVLGVRASSPAVRGAVAESGCRVSRTGLPPDTRLEGRGSCPARRADRGEAPRGQTHRTGARGPTPSPPSLG